MPQPANLVHETSTTTGTGNFTLTNVNGKQSFNSAFGTGGSDLFDYFISNQDAAEWERGTGHMSDSTTLVRDTVLESTNSDAAVNFSAGTKDVTNDIPALEQTRITRGTAQATTSGTAFDFTSLPAGLNRITVLLSGVSLSGTDQLLIQIGDSGGIETTGYVSIAHIFFSTSQEESTSTSGFVIRSNNSGNALSGSITLLRIDSNTWVGSCVVGGSVTVVGGGTKSLSAELDRVRLTRTGTDTFDAGQVNIFYE